MQITLSMEAREKRLAHRDLLIGWRWNWLKCAFLDTIRYLEITEGLSLLQVFSPANGPGFSTVMSWMNTLMSSLLVGAGRWPRALTGRNTQVVI